MFLLRVFRGFSDLRASHLSGRPCSPRGSPDNELGDESVCSQKPIWPLLIQPRLPVLLLAVQLNRMMLPDAHCPLSISPDGSSLVSVIHLRQTLLPTCFCTFSVCCVHLALLDLSALLRTLGNRSCVPTLPSLNARCGVRLCAVILARGIC